MLLDPSTLLVTMILVILLTSSSYVVVWLQDRQQVALLWMTASALLGAASFAVRVLFPTVSAIMISNPGVLAAIGCIWMACRAIRGRKVLPWALLIPGAVWIALCAVPGFLEQSGVRVTAANLLAAPLFGLAIRELWRLEGSRLVARWWVISILATQGLSSLTWGIINAFSPGPPQTRFELIHGITLTAVSSLGFMLLMSFGMVALVKERSEWRYQQAAAVDALTGLGNRRCLNENLERDFRNACRFGKSLAVVMIDADSFKAYNDLYGHLDGDACLRAIAGALQGGLLRRDDLVLRYGGEEFVVLLPNTTAAEAVQVAERLRLAVRGLGLAHAGREGGVVTISLGVAVMEPGQVIKDAASLLGAADRALYKAKKLGRDRTVCCTEPLYETSPSA